MWVCMCTDMHEMVGQGISLTGLKRLCRERGITKWPYARRSRDSDGSEVGGAGQGVGTKRGRTSEGNAGNSGGKHSGDGGGVNKDDTHSTRSVSECSSEHVTNTAGLEGGAPSTSKLEKNGPSGVVESTAARLELERMKKLGASTVAMHEGNTQSFLNQRTFGDCARSGSNMDSGVYSSSNTESSLLPNNSFPRSQHTATYLNTLQRTHIHTDAHTHVPEKMMSPLRLGDSCAHTQKPSHAPAPHTHTSTAWNLQSSLPSSAHPLPHNPPPPTLALHPQIDMHRHTHTNKPTHQNNHHHPHPHNLHTTAHRNTLQHTATHYNKGLPDSASTHNPYLHAAEAFTRQPLHAVRATFINEDDAGSSRKVGGVGQVAALAPSCIGDGQSSAHPQHQEYPLQLYPLQVYTQHPTSLVTGARTHAHAHTHARARARALSLFFSLSRTHEHEHTHTHAHIYVHARTRTTHIHTHTHRPNAHACARPHTHSNTDTHTHAHTRTLTYRVMGRTTQRTAVFNGLDRWGEWGRSMEGGGGAGRGGGYLGSRSCRQRKSGHAWPGLG